MPTEQYPSRIPCVGHDRIKITVAEWNSRPDELIDTYAYTYNAEADEFGLEPWRVVDGVDAIIAGPDQGKFDIWFASGRSLDGVYADHPLYVSEKQYNTLKGIK